MPTSSTFLSAADAFDAASADADHTLQPVDSLLTPAVLDGGLLTDQVRDALGATSDRLATVAGTLRDAATECRRRAVVCQLYWQSVAVWERADGAHAQALRDWQAADAAHRASPSLPEPGPPPGGPGARPLRPHAWVD